MCRSWVMWVLVCLGCFAGFSYAEAGGGDGVLKEKGLSPAGTTYVLGDETALLDEMKVLRTEKRAADRETKMRQAAEAKIVANHKIIDDNTKEFQDLEKRLDRIKDVNGHNRVVIRMNRLATDAKEAIGNEKELEDNAAKIGSEAKNKFVDHLMELSPKLEGVSQKYAALASDAAVKSAMEKLNAAANAKLTLGPSTDFATASNDVKKWVASLDSEAIPLRPYHGVQRVEALLNGQSVLMVVDTGASHTTIPGELAEKLKIVPGENDPVVHMKLADGNVIEGKQMMLKSVRVGRFTVENVTCVVLAKGLPEDAGMILGDSFLDHFVVKLNLKTSELHLTELKGESPRRSSPSASTARPAHGPM